MMIKFPITDSNNSVVASGSLDVTGTTIKNTANVS